MPSDHFVPRHYLRQFSVNGTEFVACTIISPYKFLGTKAIKGQCCEDDFYEGNAAVNKVLGASENDIAPVLAEVCRKQDFSVQEINALKMLAVCLFVRTRKAIEAAKLFPKHHAKSFIENAITRGDLPELPEGNSLDEAIDFRGVAGSLIYQIIPCWFESHTLAAKLLKAPTGDYFITSDNPTVVLNQFCEGADSLRSFVGFSRSGFQMLLPISANLCLMAYDAGVYKVGPSRRRVVDISTDDVALVNSLQVQSADNRLYFHLPSMEPSVRKLVGRFAAQRVPLHNFLRTYPGQTPNEEFINVSIPFVRLAKPWAFCKYRRHVKARPGDRRNPAWTALEMQLMDDIERNPHAGNVFARLEKLLA